MWKKRGAVRMSAQQEALESIAERARRALQDNAEVPRQPLGTTAPEVHPAPPFTGSGPQVASPRVLPSPRLLLSEKGSEPNAWTLGPGEMIAARIDAIRLLRELAPKRDCLRQRGEELSRQLVSTPGDSVHYDDILQWLAEARAELRQLESAMEEAQHVVRSSEWLVEVLADPTRRALKAQELA